MKITARNATSNVRLLHSIENSWTTTTIYHPSNCPSIDTSKIYSKEIDLASVETKPSDLLLDHDIALDYVLSTFSIPNNDMASVWSCDHVDLDQLQIGEMYSAHIRCIAVQTMAQMQAYVDQHRQIGICTYQDDDTTVGASGSIIETYRTFVELNDRSFVLEVIAARANGMSFFTLEGSIITYDNIDEEVQVYPLKDLAEEDVKDLIFDELHSFLTQAVEM